MPPALRVACLSAALLIAACASEQEPPDAAAPLGTVEAAAETLITCTSPAPFTTFTLDGEATVAVSVSWTSTLSAEISSGALEVRGFDNGALVASSATLAPVTFALGFGEHRLTLAVAPPGASPLAGGTCTTTVRVTRACVEASDCEDAFACSSNACSPQPDGTSECSFGPPPVAGCCVSDLDCALGTLCNTTTHTCGSCLVAADCDDKNDCTTDSCTAGSCAHQQTSPSCCDCDAPGGAASCKDDFTCLESTCNCATNTCVSTPVLLPGAAVCCEGDDDPVCDDQNPCNADSCVENQCRHLPIGLGSAGVSALCCTDDGQCNDGNPCTAEGCDVNQNVCVTTTAPLAGPGCCTEHAECGDEDPSTLDACVFWQCINTPDAAYCTSPGSSPVVINEILVDPAATSDALGEWVEVHNQTDAPVDLSGWALTELGDAPQLVVLSPGAPLVIPARGYAVLCRRAAPEENGGVVCTTEYGNGYTLANEADEVVLVDDTGAVVDQVAYDGGQNFPNPEGASIALTNPGAENDLGASWAASTAGESGDLGTPGTANTDVFKLLLSAACREKPNDDVCTLDTCVASTCDHVPVPGCCNTAADCVPPGPCLAATCTEHECSFAPIAAPECCESNAQCDDGAVCTVDVCIAHNCRHASTLSLGVGCCDSDADCGEAGNSCFKAACDPATHLCLPPKLQAGPGCCTSNTYPSPADPAECDDGDSSTIDVCKDFVCLSFPDSNYCDAQPGDASGTNHCALDGNPCTGDSCNVAEKTCIREPLANCCAKSADCFDGDPCTADACDLKTGKCTFKAIAGCCLVSQETEDCDDGNNCTTDRCLGLVPLDGTPGEFYGTCRNVRDVAPCCASALDCDDGNACTTDSCLPGGTCAYSPTVLPGGAVCCDPSVGSVSAQCDDDDTCTLDTCDGGSCKHTAIANGPGGASCCHGPTAEAVECDDKNPCTDDVCAFGWCKHLLDTSEDCCTTAADCNDGNVCTNEACNEIGGNKVCIYTTFACDDGLFCNGLEACQPGLGCQTVSPVALDDGLACTVDACVESTKSVTHTPANALCNDGKYCNGVETCDPVIGCTTGASPSQDDGVPCTQEVCDELADTFAHVPVDALCDDGKTCNGKETCSATAGCVQGAASVNDGIACTVDLCDDVTGSAAHLPDNTLCDDALICTVDVCSTSSGCSNSLAAGFCLIEGACRTAGTTHPTSGCLVCDPAVSKTTWTPTSGSAEACNTVDDDCDGKTDEGATGLPLTQPCSNACGELGVETCLLGAYTGCSAPTLAESCGDGVDNDCDGVTDGPTCAELTNPVLGAELRFTTTRGQAANVIVDNGDGTYSTGLYDLMNPNESGTSSVNAYGKVGGPASFDVKAASVLSVESILMRDTLYVDNAETRVAIQARDAHGRPVAVGTAVTVALSGGPLAAPVTLSGLTDAQGRAVLSWTASPAHFVVGGLIQATPQVSSFKASPHVITLQPAPAPLVLAAAGGGIQLPRSPRFVGETFDVPVVLNAGPTSVATYDVRITFNRFMLQVQSVTGGSCNAFTKAPVGDANLANASGDLKFNAISEDQAAACGKGAAVHVATVRFVVLAGLTPDDPTVTASVSGQVVEIRDPNLVLLASEDPLVVADATGVDELGQVRAWSAAVMGIFAGLPDAQLLAWKAITGLSDSTQLDVTGYKRDFTTQNLTANPSTSYATDVNNVAVVSTTGAVAPGTVPGTVAIAAAHKSFVSAAKLTVLHPDPLVYELFDSTLQPITGALTAANVQLFQTTRLRARTTWRDGVGAVFEHDVTDRFSAAGQIIAPGTVAVDLGEKRFASTTAGTYTTTLRTPQGTTVATAPLTVDTATPVSCVGLDVVAPCTVEMVGVAPTTPSVLSASAVSTARVLGVMRAYGQKCQVQVYARFSDGTRGKVSGTTGISFTSSNPAVAPSTSGGLLTAVTAGTIVVDAKWQFGATPICTGSAPVTVELPEPVQLVVTPGEFSLAVSGIDPAATIKKLPTGQQLSVQVIYADASSQDFTASATYDHANLDPQDLVSATAGGFVTSTGKGAGTATVRVTVAQYPGLAPASVVVDVIKAGGLTADLFETFTPTPPRVSDKIYSFIESTSTRQDANFEVLMTFNDGSSADVTSEAGLSITPVNPGTGAPQPGIVTFDKPTRRVSAAGVGTVDVLFALGPLVTQTKGVVVDSGKESIAVLVPDGAPSTFSGIKDVATATVKVWGAMGDGTRRRFSDSRFIPNLLTFSSSSPAGATINANGVMTIRGNTLTNVTVDITPAVDAPGAFDPPLSIAIPCNLLPACGDIDLGDSVGLAYKSKTVGSTFTLEGRVNTCGQPLGAFDLELVYDPLAIEITNVTPSGASVGATFNANWLGQPGTVLLNGILNPDGAPQVGDGLVLFVVHAKALATGDKVSEQSGTVVSMYTANSSSLGGAGSRPMVALVGNLVIQ